MVASRADIIAHESLGFSHVIWRGESYFVNLDSESSRLKFKKYLEKETGKEWDIAKLERYVFYIKDMYSLVGNILMLNDTFQGKVEIPINTVSCRYMFSSRSLEGVDFSDFDTSGIKDMNSMFSDCTLPKDFSLGDMFDTSDVKYMQCMFDSCTFPEDFSLGDRFDTSAVKYMHCMFYRCTLPKGFSLGDKFDTSSVKEMHSMFEDCTFPTGFSLGNKFNTSSVENMGNMFKNTKFNEDFSLAKDFTICDNAKDMFTGAELPGRVNKQLGNRATAEGIVELLKSDLISKADFF